MIFLKEKDHLAKDEFKFSVARGEKVTLEQTYTSSLKGSASGDFLDEAKIGVDITITCKYSKGTTYTGPSESSKYNCREFRMKFYEDKGNWTQTADAVTYYFTFPIETKKITRTGTYKKPTKYLSYSIDKNI